YIEIISLDSFVENKGIGSHLLNYAEIIASDMSKRSIRVITTNENIKALYFYQKNKYRITDVIFDAVTEARKIKPSIPTIDKNGIEIRDEIVLRKCL
ncbi:GNAT family N-acetyltransferase, partial [Staphylococcus aureus]